jgi:hypothetical protein
MGGVVEGIFIAERSGEPMQSVMEVTGEAGRGLLGDRHYRPDPQTILEPSCGPFAPPHHQVQDLSLVESEVLEAIHGEYGIELRGEETRRNFVTRDVRLNDLVGRQFQIGGLLCEGVELCEPCVSIQRQTGKPVLKPLVHRGGLYARIIASGTVRVGDEITAVGVATTV